VTSSKCYYLIDTETESLDDGDDIVMDTTAGGSLLTCDSISPKKSPQKSPGSSDTSPSKVIQIICPLFH